MAKKNRRSVVRAPRSGGVPIGRYIACGCIVFALIVILIIWMTVSFFGGWQAMIVYFQ